MDSSKHTHIHKTNTIIHYRQISLLLSVLQQSTWDHKDQGICNTAIQKHYIHYLRHYIDTDSASDSHFSAQNSTNFVVAQFRCAVAYIISHDYKNLKCTKKWKIASDSLLSHSMYV